MKTKIIPYENDFQEFDEFDENVPEAKYDEKKKVTDIKKQNIGKSEDTDEEYITSLKYEYQKKIDKAGMIEELNL